MGTTARRLDITLNNVGPPDVAHRKSFRKWIVGIQHVAGMAGDEGPPADGGHHRRATAVRGFRDEPASEDCAMHPLVAEVASERKQSAGVQGGHLGASPGPTRRAV